MDPRWYFIIGLVVSIFGTGASWHFGSVGLTVAFAAVALVCLCILEN